MPSGGTLTQDCVWVGRATSQRERLDRAFRGGPPLKSGKPLASNYLGADPGRSKVVKADKLNEGHQCIAHRAKYCISKGLVRVPVHLHAAHLAKLHDFGAVWI
jgi:hypothetical protein